MQHVNGPVLCFLAVVSKWTDYLKLNRKNTTLDNQIGCLLCLCLYAIPGQALCYLSNELRFSKRTYPWTKGFVNWPCAVEGLKNVSDYSDNV